MIQIFVDSRERDFLSFIGDLGEISVVHLSAGDYALKTDEKAVLIERKTFRDFVASFRNGRLWEQLVRMLNTAEFDGVPVVRRLLVIEGGPDDSGDESSKFKASVLGAELECIFAYHIPMIFLEKEEMETFLRVLVKREKEGKNDKELPERWYQPRFPSDLPVKDQRCYFLCAMPGIGSHLANKLMQIYPTLDQLCEAKPRELEKVPGIGKKRARAIFEFLH